jgi:hypothetical protein
MSKLYNKDQDYYDIAKQILLDMEVIKTCDIHDDYFYLNQWEEESEICNEATEQLKASYDDYTDYELFEEKNKGYNTRSCT